MRTDIVSFIAATACVLAGLGCGVDPIDTADLDNPGEGSGGGDAGTGSDGDLDSQASAMIVGAQVTGLLGKGLVLRTSMGQLITITADGSVTLSPSVPTSGMAVTVVSQPSEPSQVCSATLSSAGVVMVSCTTNTFKLGGVASGLLGSGLVLETGTGERLTVGGNGAFQFAGGVGDGQTYSVRVVVQPRGPSQTCVLTNGAGRVDGADVDGLGISCTTAKFKVGGEVLGLTGTGLVLGLDGGGEQKAIVADGPFSFSPLPDGSAFSVVITQLPSVDQECQVVQGKGVLSGADVNDITVACGSLGGLRINEVGSCYYVDSACWVEITNAGDTPENLGAHRLRTTARRLSTKEATHTFVLPDYTLRPGDFVVVRARSTQALGDGGGVVHVSDSGSLPWWDNSGFVELLNTTGTEDFMRFGSSTERPVSALDALEWEEAGLQAPTLPGAELGRSLSRDVRSSDTDTGGDWALRSFATPGGPNDVASDADIDGDGVPDASELPGGKFAGIDLYAMGARIGQRDIFLEVDHMDSTDPAVIPRREALDKLVSAFQRRGIALHVDVGGLYSGAISPHLYNLGGGDTVPFAKAIGIGVTDPTSYADLYRYKAAHMVAPRRSIFYYMLFGWSQQADGSRGSSGIGEVQGNDSIVTLGGYSLTDTDAVGRNVLINFQALTMMHELGHNLGLMHGGGDRLNGKPNYVSVMNYLYSLGLPSIGVPSEGDRYDLEIYCTLKYLNQLSNPPSGDPAGFVIDYSDGLSIDLNEASVDETDGLGRVNSAGVDYNCNKQIDGSRYAKDINLDGRAGDMLSDYDDWSKIDLVFRRFRAGNETGPYFPELGMDDGQEPQDDLMTDDVQAVLDQPCPLLRVP